MGALLAVLGLFLVMGNRKVTTSQIIAGTYTPRQYREWATDFEAPSEELETSPTTGKTWRIISTGRIPTPSGGSIPIPVKWPGGKINVNEMLKDVEEEAPAMEQDPGGPISINLGLRPVT